MTYSDVGGCKEQIEKLREVVETPLLHVSVYKRKSHKRIPYISFSSPNNIPRNRPFTSLHAVLPSPFCSVIDLNKVYSSVQFTGLIDTAVCPPLCKETYPSSCFYLVLCSLAREVCKPGNRATQRCAAVWAARNRKDAVCPRGGQPDRRLLHPSHRLRTGAEVCRRGECDAPGGEQQLSDQWLLTDANTHCWIALWFVGSPYGSGTV